MYTLLNRGLNLCVSEVTHADMAPDLFMLPCCWPFLGFFSLPPPSRTVFYPWYLRQSQIQNSSALLGPQQLTAVHTMHSQENLRCTPAHGCAWSVCRWMFSSLMLMEKTMPGQELQQCPAGNLRDVQGALPCG